MRIVNGVTISHNPNRTIGEIKDLKGNRYGELTVIDFVEKDKHGRARWLCQCSCGVKKVINGYNLTQGGVISCGHINREKASERMSKLSRTQGGASSEDWYGSYSSMCSRISNSNKADIKYYTNKRIKGKLIEEDWVKDAWSFYREIGPKPKGDYTIDRIDGSKGYIKGNVRWADKHTQAINQTLSGKKQFWLCGNSSM